MADDHAERTVVQCESCRGEWWSTDATEHHRPWCSLYAGRVTAPVAERAVLDQAKDPDRE